MGVGVRTTRTSSNDEKSTAGLMVMRLYDGPDFSTTSTDPMVNPFGKMPSMPEVTTRSPTTTSAVSDTYSSLRRWSPPPMATPCARDRSMSAPTAALRSLSSCTFADRAARRDDRQVGLQAIQRALVDRQRAEIGRRARRDDLGGRRLEIRAIPKLEERLESARSIGERAPFLELNLHLVELAPEGGVFRIDVAQADVVVPDVPEPGDAGRTAALHLGKQAEGHRFQHGHAASGIDLRRNENDVTEHHCEEQIAGSLTNVGESHAN